MIVGNWSAGIKNAEKSALWLGVAVNKKQRLRRHTSTGHKKKETLYRQKTSNNRHSAQRLQEKASVEIFSCAFYFVAAVPGAAF